MGIHSVFLMVLLIDFMGLSCFFLNHHSYKRRSIQSPITAVCIYIFHFDYDVSDLFIIVFFNLCNHCYYAKPCVFILSTLLYIIAYKMVYHVLKFHR